MSQTCILCLKVKEDLINVFRQIILPLQMGLSLKAFGHGILPVPKCEGLLIYSIVDVSSKSVNACWLFFFMSFSIFLSNCKDSSLKILENYQLTNDNNYVAKKIQPVKEKILKLDPTNISDDSIMKFLTLTKMISEIKESENV